MVILSAMTDYAEEDFIKTLIGSMHVVFPLIHEQQIIMLSRQMASFATLGIISLFIYLFISLFCCMEAAAVSMVSMMQKRIMVSVSRSQHYLSRFLSCRFPSQISRLSRRRNALMATGREGGNRPQERANSIEVLMNAFSLPPIWPFIVLEAV